MRALDQGKPSAVQRQRPPIGSGQPVARLDFGVSKTGITGDAGADFRKLSSLQRLQQIARIDGPPLLLAGKPLFEQPLASCPNGRTDL